MPLQTTPGAGGGGAAGSVQQRELRFKVSVVADTSQANQAFQQMGQAAQAAQPWQQRPLWQQQPIYAQQPVYGQLPSYYPQGFGQPGSPPPAPRGDPGAVGGNDLADKLNRAASVITGFVSAMNLASRALGTMTLAVDREATAREKTLGGADTLGEGVKLLGALTGNPILGQAIGGAIKPATEFGLDMVEVFGAPSKAGGKDYLFPQIKNESNLGYRAKGEREGLTARRREMLASSGWWDSEFRESTAVRQGAFDAYAADREFIRTSGGRMAEFAARNRGASQLSGIDFGTGQMSREGDALFKYAPAQRDLMFAAVGDKWVGRRDPSGRTRFDERDEYDSPIRAAERARQEALQSRSTTRGDLAELVQQSAASRGLLTGKKEEYDSAQQEADRLREAALRNPSVHQEAQKAYTAAQEKAAEYAQLLTRHQESLNKEREKTVELAQKENDLGQRNLALQQAKLGVVSSKLKGIDGQAEGYAMLDGGQRQGLMDAVRQAKERGFADLSPEQREILGGSGITHDFYAKLARESVFQTTATDDQFQGLLKDLGMQTRDDLREQKIKVQGEIELKWKVDKEDLLKALDEVSREFEPKQRAMMSEIVRIETNRQRLEDIQRQASK